MFLLLPTAAILEISVASEQLVIQLVSSQHIPFVNFQY